MWTTWAGPPSRRSRPPTIRGKSPLPLAAHPILDFFDGVWDRSADALRSPQAPGSRFFKIAGETIEIAFGAEALAAALPPALAHLSVPPSPADIVIRAWDSASTRVRMAPPPWGANDYYARGEIRGYNSARFLTHFNKMSLALNAMDMKTRRAVFWLRDARSLNRSERSTPFLILRQRWLGRRRKQVVHAAAVGGAQGAVLIPGISGAGKSTTACACLAAGMRFFGDDYCVVSDDPAPQVHSLFSSARLGPVSAARLPSLSSAVGLSGDKEDPKSIYFLWPAFRDRLPASAPLRAIFVPTQSGDRNAVEPVAPADALAALAWSTLYQIPAAGAAVFTAAARLVRALPVFRLFLGGPPEEVPQLIERFLERGA
jgi:hypothetical protein